MSGRVRFPKPALLALEQVLALRQFSPGLGIQAGQSRQCTRQVYRARIDQAGTVENSNRSGSPRDNTQADSGRSTCST